MPPTLGLSYRTSEERVTDVIGAKMSKPDRIRNAIDRTVGRFTKAQLLETCPDISETTMNGANAQTTAGRSLHPQDRRRLRLA